MVKIHKEVYGKGRPIVLIHGWAMHTGIWRDFAQQLAVDRQVICVDLPGHGLSENIDPYTLDQISEALIEDLPESFSVLGWSLGASVALNMIKHFPMRINALIMVSGNPRFIRDKEWEGTRLELLEDFAKNMQSNCHSTLIRFLTLQVYGLPDGGGILSKLKKAFLECDEPDEKVLQSGLEILKNEDLRDEFKALNIPVNIIQGDRDTLVPVQASQDMQKIRPAVEINIIPGAGHVPFLSHQAQVIKAINLFL